VLCFVQLALYMAYREGGPLKRSGFAKLPERFAGEVKSDLLWESMLPGSSA